MDQKPGKIPTWALSHFEVRAQSDKTHGYTTDPRVLLNHHIPEDQAEEAEEYDRREQQKREPHAWPVLPVVDPAFDVRHMNVIRLLRFREPNEPQPPASLASERFPMGLRSLSFAFFK